MNQKVFSYLIFIYIVIILEIKEATFESSFPNNKSNDRESKIFALKDKYSNILGNDTFKKVYLFLKKHRQLETPDDQVYI